jgi:hypothetical protein
MSLRFLGPVLLAALCAAACEDNTVTTATAPSPTTTQNFSDTLSVNGGKTFEFSSTARGTITTTVTSLTPDQAVIGVAIGTWNGLFCQQVLVKDDATQGTQMIGAVSAVGNLCLRVFDSTGQLGGPVSFSVDVAHP